MTGSRWLAATCLAVAMTAGPGCHGTGSRRTAVAEPGISGALDSKTEVVEAPPVEGVSYVDRHPLFSKPRDYWESSGDNKIVKAAAATFIGVPVGIFGEMRQIVVGAPPTEMR